MASLATKSREDSGRRETNGKAVPAWIWTSGSLAWLVGILALPSGVESPLDGLPWANPAEALVICATLPFLLLLDRSWLCYKPAFYFLALLFILKLILALHAPQAGWCLRVYPSGQAASQESMAATWEGLWRRGCSALLTRPFSEPRDFPAEWLNALEAEPRANAAPLVQLAGYAVTPPGWGMMVVARGSQGGLLRARDATGRLHELPVLKDAGGEGLAGRPLPGGVLRINGRLVYSPWRQGDWSLEPFLVSPEGKLESVWGRGVIWRDQGGAELGRAGGAILNFLAKAASWGLAVWLAAWLIRALATLARRGVLTASVAAAALSGAVLLWLLPRAGHDPLFTPHGAAFAALGTLTLLAWRGGGPGKENPSPALAVLLAVGPLLLLHYAGQWFSEAGRFTLYSLNDDWLTYQRHARDIVMHDDFWMGQRQPVFYEQPLYRYLAALLHVFFGPSPLAQNMVDVWSVLAGAGLGAALARRLGAATVWAFLYAWLYLNFELGDRFLLHIGLGLQEHAAMLCMMLAAWAALRARQRAGFIWAAGVMAALGFWLRMDHVGVLAGLGLLAAAEPGGGLVQAWKGLAAEAWSAKRLLSVYWGLLLLAAAAVFLRNWLLGGQWVLLHPANRDFLDQPLWANLVSLLSLLNGREQGVLKSAWVLWPGAVLGLAALAARWGPLRGYPLALGLSMAGLLAPYLTVAASAYFPRWSVHLLPLACLSVVMALQAIRRPVSKGEN